MDRSILVWHPVLLASRFERCSVFLFTFWSFGISETTFGEKDIYIGFLLTGSQNSCSYFWGFGVFEYHFLSKIYIYVGFLMAGSQNIGRYFLEFWTLGAPLFGEYTLDKCQIYILYICWQDHRTSKLLKNSNYLSSDLYTLILVYKIT